MSDLLARLPAWFRGDGNGGRGRACYGVTATFLSMVVFCVLVATVSYWKAFLFVGLTLTTFSIGECLAPESWRVEQSGDEQEATAGAPAAACRFGLAKAAIDSMPKFAYAPSGAEGGGDIDIESGSGELCSVCLEDLEGGEVVRRIPTCKHLFHVECIDMWLHSHTTCPICRCDLSPPPTTIAAKVAAVETEPPADDALPPA